MMDCTQKTETQTTMIATTVADVLMVTSLPEETTAKQLWEFVTSTYVHPMKRCSVLINGQAVLEFEQSSVAKAAQKTLTKKEFKGRRLTADFLSEERKRTCIESLNLHKNDSSFVKSFSFTTEEIRGSSKKTHHINNLANNISALHKRKALQDISNESGSFPAGRVSNKKQHRDNTIKISTQLSSMKIVSNTTSSTTNSNSNTNNNAVNETTKFDFGCSSNNIKKKREVRRAPKSILKTGGQISITTNNPKQGKATKSTNSTTTSGFKLAGPQRVH